MRSILRLSCTAVLLIAITALCLPAVAVELTPGDYKLMWDTNKYFTFRDGKARPVASNGRTFEGLNSSRAHFAELTETLAIIDESKGTGKGFDTVYVLPSNTSTCDLTQAQRVPVEPRDITIPHSGKTATSQVLQMRDLAEPVRVAVPIQGSVNGATREYKVSVSVATKKGIPDLVTLVLWGGVSATVETSEGSIRVDILDSNANGVFGDKSDEYAWLGDKLNWYRTPKSLPNKAGDNMPIQDPAVVFDGKPYSMVVDEASGVFKIRPYSGPTSTLLFEAFDGNGRTASKFTITIGNGKTGYWLVSKYSSSITIPVGKYHASAFVWPAAKVKSKAWLVPQMTVDDRLDLQPGESRTITVGGPVVLSLDTGRNSAKVKAGNKVTIYASTPRFAPYSGDLMPHFRISIKGKSLVSGLFRQVEPGSESYRFDLKVPKTWRPGDYLVTATLDLGAYQKPTSSQAILKITR